jgi:cytochrome c oxidase assembly factor CtaG
MDAANLDALIAATRCFGGATVGGWTLDLTITVPLALTALLYGLGVARLWRRAGAGHGVSFVQAMLFAAGWLAMAGALLSPLHDLSRRLFVAHMVEHETMMIVAAPLLVLSCPIGAMLWALPQGWRRGLGGAVRHRAFATFWAALTAPLVATTLHGVAIWGWHEPRLFQAALEIEWAHWLQHLSFFATALVFWWALISAGRARHGSAVAHLFATALHTSFLGILLVFAPHLWYAPMSAASAWGLTPLEDQQLAGLVMWIPAGLIYAGAALALAASWISTSSRHVGEPAGS